MPNEGLVRAEGGNAWRPCVQWMARRRLAITWQVYQNSKRERVGGGKQGGEIYGGLEKMKRRKKVGGGPYAR